MKNRQIFPIMSRIRQIKPIKFVVFGVSIGLLVVIFSTVVAANHQYAHISFSNLLFLQSTEPLLWIINISVLFFGLVLSLFGVYLHKLHLLAQESDLPAVPETPNADLALMVHHQTEFLESRVHGLEQEIQRKASFLDGVTTKVRPPVSGVVGMLGLLKDTELSALQKEYLTTATNSAANLVEIVNDIADHSNLENGKLEFNNIDFSLQLLIDDIIQTYEMLAQKKGLRFNASICEGLLTSIHADSTRLRQILHIFLSNAIKFTQRGKITFRLSQQKIGHDKIKFGFTIADTGIGIAQSELETLFSKSKLLLNQDSSKRTLSGLGLGIASQLVGRFAGKISVESSFAQGSSFHFSIEAKIAQQKHSETNVESAWHNRRILLISNNQTIVDSISRTLSQYGIASLVCAKASDWQNQLPDIGPRESDSIMDNEWFDIVLIEQLSVANQYKSIVARINLEIGIARVKFLLLAAPGQRGDAQVATDAGINAYLSLPFSPEQLLEIMSRLLGFGEGSQLLTKHTLEEEDFQLNRILVVEDNPVNQQAAKAILNKLGMAVDVVANGNDAIDYSRQHHYKLVLMDCHMPVMDGFETARQIRAQEEAVSARPVPIVAMTVDVHPLDRQQCIDSGMDDFITKPVTLDLLNNTVNRWMRKAG